MMTIPVTIVMIVAIIGENACKSFKPPNSKPNDNLSNSRADVVDRLETIIGSRSVFKLST